ncbi:ParB/RepB/Spo0J family partition protein [Roseovarius nubinhibens]|uniref:Chromosome partitioning protein parB n=1 Tax=Roseovarius nubinhibens (strain ATCC BAA-591 / DSM 15170 / ISM) TaxID=89187 RepID=A3SKT5_ROSNI|nr:ParB/RepB/Spo0J family partition protein [Roseovarius nubinhibens]EAP77966.1 chromosome partitioning protein parB [Roseovarius nubinhibens ISM]
MADKKGKQRGLGRGLSALMADVGDASTATAEQPRSPDRMVAIDLVLPNPDQPRRRFDEEKLEDLANSIAEKGIIQPLIVRSHPSKENHFEIVAGERRWRAAQRAKVHQVPVVIKEFNDTEVLEIAIIENIQRADLNPVEEAAGYAQLMEKFGHTQDKLSQALGKSRSHIANTMRLLQLPPAVQGFLSEGQLSAGHARALITSDDAEKLAKQVISKGLSVRQTEALVKSASKSAEGEAKPAARKVSAKDADTRALEGDLSANLGMKVSIDHIGASGGGKITLTYSDLDQLDALCSLLSAGLPDGSI